MSGQTTVTVGDMKLYVPSDGLCERHRWYTAYISGLSSNRVTSVFVAGRRLSPVVARRRQPSPVAARRRQPLPPVAASPATASARTGPRLPKLVDLHR